MKFVIQRVTSAQVDIDGVTVGKIGHGLMVLIGVSHSDDEAVADKMVDKLLKLRIFDDSEGKTNLSSSDINGEFLLVSQFTLYADCKKGNRPSFTDAGAPQMASDLYEYIIKKISDAGFVTQRGEFGADMKVSLVNDGPFTIVMDSEQMGFHRS